MLTEDEFNAAIHPMDPIPTGLKPSGSIEEKITCLMFDIYGTLFISGSGDINPAKTQSKYPLKLERLFRRFGTQRSTRGILENFFEAIQHRHKEMKQNGIDFPEVEIDRIWMKVLGITDRQKARALAMAFEVMVNPVYPMPHLKKLLTACEQRRIPLGIISNAQFYTPHLFQWFLASSPEELGFVPNLIFYSYRFGRAKPSDVLYRLAAEQLTGMGIPVESTLFVGNDMLNDVYPAQGIGFKTALFAGDARSLRLRQDHPICQTLAADLVVTDLMQLINWV